MLSLQLIQCKLDLILLDFRFEMCVYASVFVSDDFKRDVLDLDKK
jgi:hypothetical protein